jgi:hypothetical protein
MEALKMSSLNMNTPTLKEKIIDGHSKLSDMKAIWFPFYFLRPPSHKRISLYRTLVMAPCFGAFFTLLIFIKRLIFKLPEDTLYLSNILILFAQATLGFFLWFNLVTRPLWNSRREIKTTD